MNYRGRSCGSQRAEAVARAPPLDRIDKRPAALSGPPDRSPFALLAHKWMPITPQDASRLRGREKRLMGHGARLTGPWRRHPLIRPRRPSSQATTRSGSSSVARTEGAPQRAWAGTSPSGCAAAAPCTSAGQQVCQDDGSRGRDEGRGGLGAKEKIDGGSSTCVYRHDTAIMQARTCGLQENNSRAL